MPASTVFRSSLAITAWAEEFCGSILPLGEEARVSVNVSSASASSSPFTVTDTVLVVSPGENVKVPEADS